ncbi:hypothetical protein C923_02887 [Plasmodium falciparum UGT5.1]|uniref:Heptatricopeptide repeat-containing protein, putative n=11 Tax=Plasmodium falciparum TaxID=5833 RepID=Q8IJS9_PLAF7|nr:heptatricopeptide repeat-containing protein, putative [Plasmodium falciparum 3D7]ETW18280.1 hypothetical protein PFFVO_02796 [Plasmodium falciparum Vietnam Oak-Knoll (FVO)]ETW27087.1 hypothetical protein PFFCH_05493 [Plasmodium falciparum FCH/4]ETW36454.1 hypothetical protein PFTANZ_02854 [Plasmodium falciparum Tanzania (2000708)]ETW42682.1 hypothetical protein PFNF135_02954 [Plasmodium falciparum NF135/5.C10]ETW49096.1 hypothetical protein PFMALIP_02799 [Plasmodium falciparum MaliPS096_E11|eukprot:XP_001347398.1 conserved Plasmodium protein, unknown function [Plasmodium falciparum 3D7]
MLMFMNVFKRNTGGHTIKYLRLQNRFISNLRGNGLYKKEREECVSYENGFVNISRMNSSVLCIFSNMLLKENVQNNLLWKRIEKRSYELINDFEVNEIASFLFCLSKVRYDTNLYDNFIPLIKRKCEYFNTSNLAMLISTYSKKKRKKNNKTEDDSIIMLLKNELKKKVHTIYNIVEISMILNALVKSNIKDNDLYAKLSNIIIDNVMYNNVHIRDLCVITYCYANILYNNDNLFIILSQRINQLIEQANLVDLCRILYSYMRIKKNYNHILKSCTIQIKDVMYNRSSISDVINCIHFLPNLKEIIDNEQEEENTFFEDYYNGNKGIGNDKICDNTYNINCTNVHNMNHPILYDRTCNYHIDYFNLYNYVIHTFNKYFISYIHMLTSKQISNILYIYSRYNILICPSTVHVFIEKIKNMQLTKELKIYILYSLSILLKNYELKKYILKYDEKKNNTPKSYDMENDVSKSDKSHACMDDNILNSYAINNSFENNKSCDIFKKKQHNVNIYNFYELDINKIFFMKPNPEHIIKENENIQNRKNNFLYINNYNFVKLKNNLIDCLILWEQDINDYINNHDFSLTQDVIRRVLNIFLILNYSHASVIYSIRNYVILNYKNINEHNAYMIMYYFQQLNKLNDDDDFAEILTCKMKSLK